MSRLRLVLVLCLLMAAACSDQLDVKGEEIVEFESKELLKGFGSPSSGQAAPQLTIYHTQAAWDAYCRPLAEENENLATVSPDWAVSVVLLLKLSPTGGMEASPYIASILRDGDAVSLSVDWRIDETAPMLDMEVQPWIIATAPAEAFSGEVEVRFEVVNSGPGEVLHLRD